MGMMNEHYSAVLADMRSRKQRLETELAELETVIQSILRLRALNGEGGGETPQHPAQAPKPITVGRPSATRFHGISVRWAILWHLSEEAARREKTGEIADALRAGGFQSNAANFSNQVSGVLSLMKVKKEVESTEDGTYAITDEGRRTWQLIRQGEKFRSATVASEPSPLFVQ
jgi:hypothetical protein